MIDDELDSEARNLRRVLDELEAEVRRIGAEPVPSTTLRIVQVFREASLPTSADRFYATHPADVTATETEGSTATLSVDASSTFYTRILNGLASAGENLVAASVPYRWHAQKVGEPQSLVTPSGCPCASPTTLYLWSQAPNDNLGMFLPTTLVYGPVPSGLAGLGMGANAYLSPGSFTDTATGDFFQYHLYCFGSSYLLTRVYITSLYGSPFRDLARFSWLPGLSGNTCSPFALTNGQVYAGGDLTTVVEITGTNVHGI